MIIIQLAGGLGNQMFQYALYLQLKSLGKEVKIDDRTGFLEDRQRKPSLVPFGISYERVTGKELERMLDCAPYLWSKVRRKLFGRNKKAYFEADKRYKPEVMSWDDIYLEGYWQTEKYFSAVSGKVREAYDIGRLLQYIRRRGGEELLTDAKPVTLESTTKTALFEQYLAQIASTESVSVHIRRGDYLLPENQALFGGICTAAYYKEAMEQMKQRHPQCRFYLFTNDKQWIREQLGRKSDGTKENSRIKEAGEINEDIEVIDVGGQGDYEEFALMSRCRHHILANSSFSWWASYLSGSPDKTVLAPDRWLNGWDCSDFYRDDMHKVTMEGGA